MADPAGAAFTRLVDIVARLRAPGGCPWDREQTLETLRPFVLEETYEVLEAIDGGNRPALREEIGDLIFEGVLLAQVCSEAGDFTVADSLTSIADKLLRRHPHVFGDAAKAKTADEVLGRWEAVKAEERAASPAGDTPKSILGGVPKALPALARAFEMGTRAAAVGFDWERATDVLAKIEEEVAELRQAVEGGGSRARVEEEMGDLLFAIANLSRKLGIEPEAALRTADDKFARRFTAMEHRFAARGEQLQGRDLDTLEREWQAVKTTENEDHPD
ncbi:MAG TPA: nucleoside triphosphate pyrophosphohydrolase [Vicinamibacterales bacterium]|jgi:MazG family protein